MNSTIMSVVLGGIICISAASHAATPWKHLTTSDGLPSSQVQFIKTQGADVWVGTLAGLSVFRNGKLEAVEKNEAVWDVMPVSDGLWFGTDNGIVFQKGAVTDRSITGEAVGRIVRFGTNAIWAVSKKSDSARVMEFSAGKWQPVKRFAGLKPSEMFVTRSGVVWVMLEANGVVVADPAQAPEQWKHHQQGVNLTSFCEDKQGRVWCGTWDRGVMYLENGEWKRMMTDIGSVVTAVRQDGKGHMWLATNSNGVWQYDGANWVNHLNEEGTINMLETTPDGKLYVSSQSECSLRQWTGTAWDKILDVPTMFITVQLDAKGKLWAGNILDGVYVQP
jgi:ligand-binding sensor domain-containing protein